MKERFTIDMLTYLDVDGLLKKLNEETSTEVSRGKLAERTTDGELYKLYVKDETSDAPTWGHQFAKKREIGYVKVHQYEEGERTYEEVTIQITKKVELGNGQKLRTGTAFFRVSNPRFGGDPYGEEEVAKYRWTIVGQVIPWLKNTNMSTILPRKYLYHNVSTSRDNYNPRMDIDIKTNA